LSDSLRHLEKAVELTNTIRLFMIVKSQFIFIALFFMNTCFVARSQTQVTKRAWTAYELWSQSISENLLFQNDSILLDGNLLIEKDAKEIGSVRPDAWDTLSPEIAFRKYLSVAALPAKGAIITMLIYPVYPKEPMSGGKLEFRVNGRDPIIYEVRHFWTSVQVPVEYLKQGENLIEVTVHGTGVTFRTPVAVRYENQYGSVGQTSFSSGSYRSKDGGRKWTSSRGEYPIRLKLQAFHGRGALQTPVINLSDSAISGVLLRPASVEWVKFKLELHKANGGKKMIRFRSGNTHQPECGGWTEWQLLDQDFLPADFHDRFVQFEFSFEKNSDDRSPVLTGFSLESGWRFDRTIKGRILLSLAVNHPVSRHSFYFQHEDPSLAALLDFRQRYQLDTIVNGASNEWEKIKKLRGWVAGLWDWYIPEVELPDMLTWDARQILDPKKESIRKGGFCLHYAIVFAQACQSFGIPARIVTLNYSVWGGHEVAEVWSRDYEKWIMIDAQFDAIFYNRKTGVPCSVLELHDIFLNTYYPGNEYIDRDRWTIQDRNYRSANIDPEQLPVAIELGGNAESGKLDKAYVWWKAVSNTVAPGYSGGYGFFNAAEVRWFPRSNWLSNPESMPVSHGRTHWGWDGYLCWTDSKTPETPEHRYFIRRPSDIYSSLYLIDFTAEPAAEGILRINMVTDSPGFKSFEITDNNNSVQSDKPVYLWKLLPGKNSLEIKSADIFGNTGSSSRLVIDYSPKKV